jgi:hypothetical protein
MDASTLVAGAVAGLTITAAWLDLRKRTNGSGPLAKKLDEHGERLGRIEDRSARTEERLGDIDQRLGKIERNTLPRLVRP